MGRLAAARTAADARRRHHGLPRIGAQRPPAQARRDERAAARDGSNAELRPVQPRKADLRGIEIGGRGAAVREAVTRCERATGTASCPGSTRASMMNGRKRISTDLRVTPPHGLPWGEMSKSNGAQKH